MKLVTGIAVLALAGTTASASSLINIDLGTVSPTAFGTPGAGYGAAAGQVGFWNNIGTMNAAQSFPLNDISGAPSGASISSLNTNFSFSFNNAGTSGDDQALMDDGLDLGGIGSLDTFTITGLAAGTYQVYVYAWAPDSATFVTSSIVNGSPAQTSGGAWPGGFAAGTTHNAFNVTLGAGQPLIINTSVTSGFGTLNGIQIIPTPGALAAFGLAGLAASRRRR